VTLTTKGQRAVAVADEVLEAPPDALKELTESELKKLALLTLMWVTSPPKSRVVCEAS
jgi:hypothetical protein